MRITMKTLTLSVVLLSLTSLTLSQEDTCGGPQSTVAFNSIYDTSKYYCRCTFPTHKLDSDCILSSCPKLSGVCPLKSGCVDQPALDTAVSILNTCLRQNAPICGINMAHMPMVQFGWTTKELLPIDVANGTCWSNPGEGYLLGLSSAQYSVCPAYSSNGLINLSIQTAEINNTAFFNCTFKLPSTSFLQPLTSTFPSLTSLNTQNMTGITYINVSTTVSIDLSTQPPTTKILDDASSHYLSFYNFYNQNGVALPCTIADLFNQTINSLLKSSVISATATTFLTTYAALSLQAAQQDCP